MVRIEAECFFQILRNSGINAFYRVIYLCLLFHLDINKCEASSSRSGNASSNNTDGSFNCTCSDGYTGDGFTCDGKMYIHYSNKNSFLKVNLLMSIISFCNKNMNVS